MSKNEPIQKKINVQIKTDSENKKCPFIFFLSQNKIPNICAIKNFSEIKKFFFKKIFSYRMKNTPKTGKCVQCNAVNVCIKSTCVREDTYEDWCIDCLKDNSFFSKRVICASCYDDPTNHSSCSDRYVELTHVHFLPDSRLPELYESYTISSYNLITKEEIPDYDMVMNLCDACVNQYKIGDDIDVQEVSFINGLKFTYDGINRRND